MSPGRGIKVAIATAADAPIPEEALPLRQAAVEQIGRIASHDPSVQIRLSRYPQPATTGADGERQMVGGRQLRVVARGAGNVAVAAHLLFEEKQLPQPHL